MRRVPLRVTNKHAGAFVCGLIDVRLLLLNVSCAWAQIMRVCGLSDVRLLLVNVSCAWAQIMHVCVWSNRRTFAAGECELCLGTNNARVWSV